MIRGTGDGPPEIQKKLNYVRKAPWNHWAMGCGIEGDGHGDQGVEPPGAPYASLAWVSLTSPRATSRASAAGARSRGSP